MKKFRLELIVFVCGAMVMVFELVGSRVVAPYVGTSTFVWTNLIGVILASLSLGYYLGGKMADKNPKIEVLAWIIFSSSILIVFTWLFKDLIMTYSGFIVDNRLRALLSAIILFVPASLFLGMVSPYAFKLKLSSLKHSGETAGTLYALSTLGSIVGTFLAGFYLIPTLGTQKLLILIALILVTLTLIIKVNRLWYLRVLLSLILLILLFFNDMIISLVRADSFIDLDTKYSRVWIYDNEFKGKEVRVLMRDDKFHSARFLNSDELVFDYTKYYDIANEILPKPKKTLMIGGAAYSYPQYFLKKYPGVLMDVVEIDPKLTELAKEYFSLKEDDNLNIYHQDARIYINNNQKKYDIIYGDAFASHYSVPHHLTTWEFNNMIHDSLNNEGVYIMNIISSLEGSKSKYLQAQYNTIEDIFSEVLVFPVIDKDDKDLVQNIMLVAYKGEKSKEELISKIKTKLFKSNLLPSYTSNSDLFLTDDYAPVEFYINTIN